MRSSRRAAFTLIELLVVIAIIAILAVVVVLTLNPAQLLAQSRDANRVSDMATLNTAIGLYQTDTGGKGSLGTSSVAYVSLPDATISGNATSTCTSLGLPALPSGNYQCTSPQGIRDVDGTGWIPLNFQQISSGAPFGSLPVDPANQSSSNFFYTYVSSGTQYMVSATPESLKQKQTLGQVPIVPNYPDVIANGSNLTINPLYNSSGLFGYWPMDEGTGSSVFDTSGNGNLGTWHGSAVGTSGYYSAGKVGSWAGTLDGSSAYVSLPTSPTLNGILGNITMSVWFKQSAFTTSTGILYLGSDVGGGWGAGIQTSNGVPTFSVITGGIGYNVTSTPVSLNTWYYLVGVRSGTVLTIYINGSAVGASTAPSGALRNFGQNNGSSIGNLLPYVAYGTGLVDELRIYNRALSPAEIQAMYNAEK